MGVCRGFTTGGLTLLRRAVRPPQRVISVGLVIGYAKGYEIDYGLFCGNFKLNNIVINYYINI